MTAKAKIVGLSDQDALLFGLPGFPATKLWNAANWNRRAKWKEIGKIPSYVDQASELKTNAWSRQLHSQTARAVLEKLARAYRSGHRLRKAGHRNMKPPGFMNDRARTKNLRAPWRTVEDLGSERALYTRTSSQLQSWISLERSCSPARSPSEKRPAS